MEKFLPLFPLNLVAYPLEELNLHIFEPRYRQLINECLDQDTTFGIPTYLNNTLPGFGTEMRVTQLVKRYDDGQMDVRTQGIQPFRIIDFENPAPNRLYSGGFVNLLGKPKTQPPILPELLFKVKKLYEVLGHEMSFDIEKAQPYSYQISHKIGLSLEDEYKILTMPTETERQEFLVRHLTKVIPTIQEMERTRERIRLNGHFKNLDPLKF